MGYAAPKAFNGSGETWALTGKPRWTSGPTPEMFEKARMLSEASEGLPGGPGAAPCKERGVGAMSAKTAATAEPDALLTEVHADLVRTGAPTRVLAEDRGRFRAILGEVLSLPAETRVLDAGMGWGHLAVALKRLGRPVSAVDYYYDETARAAAARVGIEYRCLHLEAEPLSWPDAHFGAVVFAEVLEHLNYDPLPVLGELARVLAPAGRLVLTTPNAASLRNALKLLAGRNVLPEVAQGFAGSEPETIGGRPYYYRHHRLYTRAEVEWLVGRVGLSVARSACLDPEEAWRCRGRNAWARTACNLVGRLVEGRRAVVMVVGEKP